MVRLLFSFAALLFALLAAAGPQPAIAVPSGPGAAAKQAAAQSPALVQQTSGCHAACRFGYMPRLGYSAWHRHVGPRCWPVRC